ncbi:Uncharacterised protein [Chromobacterium violaceum]|uniref:Uncharacterized protein n=1 Tax=Chromobacterium violaceum TaxID=536 RepID=A0A447TG93_CHRVL|nr:Uncharacterised protein [Chromobacterium violaceum]
MAAPFSFNWAISSNSRSISRSVSAAVGSSMISTRALSASALAISTICCWPMDRLPASASGSMPPAPSASSCARASRRIAA